MGKLWNVIKLLRSMCYTVFSRLMDIDSSTRYHWLYFYWGNLFCGIVYRQKLTAFNMQWQALVQLLLQNANVEIQYFFQFWCRIKQNDMWMLGKSRRDSLGKVLVEMAVLFNLSVHGMVFFTKVDILKSLLWEFYGFEWESEICVYERLAFKFFELRLWKWIIICDAHHCW